METAQAIIIAAIGVLIVLSALFSGSETALTAASRPRLHHLSQKGIRRARLAERLIEDRERFIGAILLGNNAVNILASALATSVLISVVGDAGVAYATIGMTLVILIFAEVLPKTYAIRNADRAALAVAPAIVVVVWLLSPVVRAVQAIVFATLRLVGAHRRRGGAEIAQEELRGAISLHAREGAVIKHERHRKNMIMIDADAPPRAILDLVVEHPYTRYPVWRGEPDNIVGVLHAKDLLSAIRANWDDLDRLNITAIASRPWFVPETTTLREQLNAFRARRAHFALVVDEYGSLMGLVTLEDILEEIVGDIADEHDIALRDVVPQADGSYLIPGTVTIRDLNRRYDWALPDEEATTIAGLLLHEAQTIPEIDQAFTYHGFTFEVRGRQRNQITLLRLIPPAAATADEEV
jgi:Mg2+/Co2+ transporter CorB